MRIEIVTELSELLQYDDLKAVVIEGKIGCSEFPCLSN
jgi:hypothetical protein